MFIGHKEIEFKSIIEIYMEYPQIFEDQMTYF